MFNFVNDVRTNFPGAARFAWLVEIEVQSLVEDQRERLPRERSISADFSPRVGRKSPAGESYFERRDATLPRFAYVAIEQVQTRAPPCFARSTRTDNCHNVSTKRRRPELFRAPDKHSCVLVDFRPFITTRANRESSFP